MSRLQPFPRFGKPRDKKITFRVPRGVRIQDLNSERVVVYLRPESPPPSPIITYIQLNDLIDDEPEVVTLE